MLTLVQLLRNVGQFDSVTAGATIPLNKFVLVYAENGRGKTTLTAILRSLATGDPVPISERRRLAAANPPHVVLRCSGGDTPAVFENGIWSRTFPDLLIFDDRFVNENVYSGVSVEPGHRQNLHELVLGAQGVTLNRRLQELVARIERHNTDLRGKADAIPLSIRGTLSVRDFCLLPSIPSLEDRIQSTERGLAAAQEQDLVRTTPGLDIITLPTFDTEAIAALLRRDLPALDNAAANRVQQHLLKLGRGGESWVADGVPRIVHTENGNDICPFCAQDLTHSSVINHYRAYFGEEYSRLKQSISDALGALDRLHGGAVSAGFERALRIAIERRQFWARFCDVPEIALDTESLAHEWGASRDGLIAILRAKQTSPLERIEIPERVRPAIDRFMVFVGLVATLNQRLQEANNAIRMVREQAAAADLQTIGRELAALRVIRARYSADVPGSCEEYLSEETAKAATEHLRNRAKADLEQYRATAFPEYQVAINAYLGRFNAGYTIGRVTPVDTRGGPTCNYDVVINNTPISISGGVTGPTEPAFRNTLSSGDRNTLALAFFFAAVDRDPGLENKVVVIDDPITSLDDIAL
jgi:wobble nucleotide-excising tRNase